MKKNNMYDDIFIVVYNKDTKKVQFVKGFCIFGRNIDEVVEFTDDQREAYCITADSCEAYIDDYYDALTAYQDNHPDTEFLYVGMKGLLKHER